MPEDLIESILLHLRSKFATMRYIDSQVGNNGLFLEKKQHVLYL